VSDRLPVLVPAYRVHALLYVDVVADLCAHKLRLAQITTITNPTTAPTTKPTTGATRESKNATVSRPPRVEVSSTTARAMIRLALYDTMPQSRFPVG
jgi:hypothetical protein